MFNIHNLFKKKNISEFPNTPDYEALQDAPGWPFFEYGELKNNMPMHKDVLWGLSPRRIGYTTQQIPLWMWNDNHTAYPVAVNIIPSHHPVRRSRVQGELYVIPTTRIPHLDNFRLNGVEFHRKEISVTLNDDNTIKAFAYIGNKDHWQARIRWIEDFYKGRKNSVLSLIPPKSDNKYTGWYSSFTKDHFNSEDTKCFIGLFDGARPQQQAA
jgi:gamma-glutamylcyclotransferase (GGCT)/AIG2-like uncharacterized protein YtfP